LIGSYLFFAGSAVWAKYSSPKLFRILKPAPLFLLILFSVVTSQSYLLIVALAFSLFGDIFLLNKEKFFVQGLISFLIAHLFYLSLFIKSESNPNPIIGVIMTIIAVFYFGYLKKYLGKYLYPVFLYLTVILLMVIFAAGINNGNRVIISTGAILFFISDGILAFNKFIKQFNLADFLVLSTYYTAQLLLVWGLS
jgi:alkenylglycerophosphocholine/alkenylglycerophosphoethanolamine hydrolase